MTRNRKRWTYTAGRRPYSVAIEEFELGGNFYVRIWSRREQKHRYKSLGHRDRQRAIDYAEKAASRLREGAEAVITSRVTLERLFRIYRAHRTPQKSAFTQVEDERRFELFKRVFGAQRCPYAIGVGDWDRFIAARRSGAIDSRGEIVPEKKRRPVRDRTIQADLGWLNAVFNWALMWRAPEGEYLLRENPVRGYARPREKNPRRAIISEERYQKLLEVADSVTMEVLWGEARERVRSHLRELLILANGTGRRISAICQLRFQDLRLDRGPRGSVRWPADTDKMGKQSVVPISDEVREVIDDIRRDRPGVGSAPLFPAPGDPSAPIRYELASDWLHAAERLAKLETQQGALWHAFRRKWATERKHLPNVDVAAAGGWNTPQTLVEVYQQPDQDTMYRVVSEGSKLREA